MRDVQHAKASHSPTSSNSSTAEATEQSFNPFRMSFEWAAAGGDGRCVPAEASGVGSGASGVCLEAGSVGSEASGVSSEDSYVSSEVGGDGCEAKAIE